MNYLIALLVINSIRFSYGICPVGQVKESGVNTIDMTKATTRHNYWRTQLAQNLVPGQPKASNMKRMYYDGYLGVAAQSISNTCNFQHVTVTDARWPAVGQNLYMSMSSGWTPGADWNKAIDAWFAEHKDFTYPNVSVSGKMTGRYTQVAWANSQYLGCGYTAWYESNTYKKLYVCNYGPAGNYIGQAPYLTGVGCENLC